MQGVGSNPSMVEVANASMMGRQMSTRKLSKTFSLRNVGSQVRSLQVLKFLGFPCLSHNLCVFQYLASQLVQLSFARLSHRLSVTLEALELLDCLALDC